MAPEFDGARPAHFWRQAIRNSFWLSVDRLVRGVTGLVVLICLGRFLGPEQYGLYSFAVAFVAIFAAFGSLSHEGILVRELVREDRSREAALGSAFVLRALGGMVGMVLAAAMAWLLPGARAGAVLIAIIAVGLLFQPFDIIDHWFQSRLHSRPVVLVRSGAAVLVGMCKVALAMRRATLPALAWLSVAEAVLVAIGLLGIYCGKQADRPRWRMDRTEMGRLLRESWPLAASALLVMLFMRLDQILLARFVGFRELGVYASAVRLIDAWNFIPLAVMPSLYPAVVALRQRDADQYRRLIQRLLFGFHLLALALVMLNVLAGKTMLGLLFGAEYVGAAPALAILSVATVFHYSASIRAQWLLIEHKVSYHLVSAAIGVAALIVMNSLLIPRYGFIGAALATSAGYAVTCYGTSLVFPALRPFGQLQTRAFLFRWWSNEKAVTTP